MMIKQMHKQLVLAGMICLAAICNLGAQPQTVKQLQETARTLMQQGDLDNAVATLERAAGQDPANTDVLKTLSYACYLKRDFSKAINLVKPLIEKSDADQQTFQILGLSYKAIAAYKECGKLYRNALKKFPNSAIIYNEYGELLAMDNRPDEAIQQWEKGIALDPNYSSDYYNACIYYTRKNDWLRVLIYGELFLNLESFSGRTADVKKAVLDAWKNIYTPTVIPQLQQEKNNNAFEKNVLEVLAKTATQVKEGFTADNSTSLRTRFVLEWFREKAVLYPFRLFEHQQYLIKEGLFEAYNQWLFGEVANEAAYQVWQNTHPKEAAGYKVFQQSRVFKLPEKQYYFAK